MKIIQSLECLELLVNVSDNNVNFSRERLKGKNISSLYLFSNTEDSSYYSPFKEEYLTQLDEISRLGLYLNLFDENKALFINKLASQLITLYSESHLDIIELDVNRKINWDLSNFQFINSTNDTNIRLLFYAAYNQKPIERFTDLITGSVNIELPVSLSEAYNDIRLSDVIDRKLIGKKIKKVQVLQNNSVETNQGYLYLVTNKGIISNIPLSWLEKSNQKSFWFDNLVIDYQNSFYRQRGYSASNLITFLY